MGSTSHSVDNGPCFGAKSDASGSSCITTFEVSEITGQKFEFESNPQYIPGRFVPVDLTSSYDKYTCEVIAKLAISTYYELFQRHRPARELVEVVEAKARNFNSRVLFKVIFDAKDLCEGGLIHTYRCFAYHGTGKNELVTLMHKETTDDTPNPLKPRPMHFEEKLTYNDEIKSSEGFDVTALPGVYGFGMIQPVDLSIESEKNECMEFARVAIKAFNDQVEDSKGELHFDELFKAMHCGVNGVLYYLTFSAIKRDEDKIMCRAIVHASPVNGDVVTCFRLKTSDSEQDSYTGQWRSVWDRDESRLLKILKGQR